MEGSSETGLMKSYMNTHFLLFILGKRGTKEWNGGVKKRRESLGGIV